MMERLLEIQPGMVRRETQAHTSVAGSRKIRYAKSPKHFSARRSYRARREEDGFDEDDDIDVYSEND